jgi:hypothetical protein
MGEPTQAAVAAQCECADCRQYRLWRVGGTDEWQPDLDDWNARSAAIDAYVDVGEPTDARTPEALSSY